MLRLAGCCTQHSAPVLGKPPRDLRPAFVLARHRTIASLSFVAFVASAHSLPICVVLRLQNDDSNWLHPLGFAYEPDGAHEGVDELEAGIDRGTSGAGCANDNTCQAPMYYFDSESESRLAPLGLNLVCLCQGAGWWGPPRCLTNGTALFACVRSFSQAISSEHLTRTASQNPPFIPLLATVGTLALTTTSRGSPSRVEAGWMLVTQELG